MTTTEFARGRNIQPQTISIYIRRHAKRFEGHTSKDGKTLELEKESGEPMVGDGVVSEDGEYLLPDGRTVVVEGHVITEIRPAEEEAVEAEAERGEEPGTDEAEFSEKDAEIDRLKAIIAEKDAEIEELKKQLEEAQANAKSEEDAEILNMVAVAGGREWLKGIHSQGAVDKRSTDTNNLDKTKAKADKPMTFTEYRKAKAERKNNNKSK